MIYITFDTNILIYALDDSWVFENQIEYIEDWISKGEVSLLIPDVILEEWSKHKIEQAEVRAKDLKKFFNTASRVLPGAFYREYNNPETIKLIIRLVSH